MINERKNYPLPKKASNRILEIIKPWTSKRRLHDLENFLALSKKMKTSNEFKSDASAKKFEIVALIEKLQSTQTPKYSGDTIKEYAGIRLQTEEWRDKSALQVLFGHHFRDSGIVNVDFGDNLQIIVAIIEALSGNSRNPHIVFSVGIGGYPYPPSIRLPAHIVRPLEAMRKLKYFASRRNVPLKTELHIFRADHIAIEVNGFNHEEVKSSSKITRRFINSFLDEFYADIRENVIVETDYPLIQDSYADFMIRDASLLLKNLRSHQRYTDSIRKMGSKHGQDKGQDNSFFYAAAHPFYNGSILIPNADIFRPSLKAISEDTIVIDYGGRPQHTFNQLGRVLIREFSSQFLTPGLINVLHSACKTPGYDHLRDEHGNLSDLVVGAAGEENLETKLYGRYFNDMRTIYSHINEQHYKDFLATFSG